MVRRTGIKEEMTDHLEGEGCIWIFSKRYKGKWILRNQQRITFNSISAVCKREFISIIACLFCTCNSPYCAFCDFKNPIVNGPFCDLQQLHTGLNMTFNTQQELLLFKKSIKCDTTVYPILKDERKFDTFETEFLAMVRTHDIEEVFDPNYTPNNLNDTYLFKEKQNFAYAILLRSIQTDKGRTAV